MGDSVGQYLFEWAESPLIRDSPSNIEWYGRQAEVVYQLLHDKHGLRDSKEIFVRNAMAYMFGMARLWEGKGSAYDRAKAIRDRRETEALPPENAVSPPRSTTPQLEELLIPEEILT